MMTELHPSPRHLTRQGLDEYLKLGDPAMMKIVGAPAMYLIVDPPASRIAVRAPRDDDPLGAQRSYRHFQLRPVVADGEWTEVEVIAPASKLPDAYAVLCGIADAVQLEGLTISKAARKVLSGYKELLAGLTRLTDEEEVGLFGELLLFRHIIKNYDGETAVRSWRGAAAEEHDFELTGFDVEVKTTTAETRRHWIASSTQLLPSPDRQLWLLSIQLTTAVAGGATLPEMISGIGEALSISQGAVFAAAVRERGWEAAQTDVYVRGFRLRSRPAAFSVDDAFPAITPARLQVACPSSERFLAIRYLLDLTGLQPSSDPPSAIVLDSD